SMESLTETPWDVTISGTGLAQSLLALGLSRSGKKVLHVDKNPYYGGSEAAFSLREAEEWAATVNKRELYRHATVYSPEDSSEADARLSSPRAYTLALSPHLIYSRSQLLPTLVSSKVYRQLEFQAVGSWWIHKPSGNADDNASSLYRVPGSREDVFADDVITLKSKRTLMKFLRHIGKPQQDEEATPEESEDLSMPFSDYLTSKFQVPAELHNPLLSLSLSQNSPQQTPAEYAVLRVKRHLASIGVFGPGFGSLIPKWGGGSEIAQVGCRALAVGGGVYVLDSSIQSITDLPGADSDEDARMQAQLSIGESIRTKFLVGSKWDLPAEVLGAQPSYEKVARSITVVSSPLGSLFPVTAEGGPIPAGAVVVFPGTSLGEADDSPVYLLVHSSDTGECPTGQSVIYGSVNVSGPQGQSLLETAVQKLLQSTVGLDAKVLWSLRYTQLGRRDDASNIAEAIRTSSAPDKVICFPPPSLDLAFDDALIDMVKEAWTMIMGAEAAQHEFMTFEDRENHDEE
ncbi:hypothetical protein ASPWEDRAFT_103274, partial [Aspergillus wentii DTO 134E9]